MENDFWASFDKEFYSSLKELNDCFSPTPFTQDDIRRSDEIVRQLFSIHKNFEPNFEGALPFNTVLQGSLEYLYKIGCSVSLNDTVSILNNLEYRMIEGAKVSTFVTNSMIVNANGSVSKKAVSIYAPEFMNESSKIFMLHEISHILKERNNVECQNAYTLMEFIPMLIELISAYKSKNKKLVTEIVVEREKMLYAEAIKYCRIKKEINDSCNISDKEILETALGTSVVYLNSFYYTLAVFNYYLDNEGYIIDLISAILNGQLTTFDMIDKFILRDSYFSLSTEYNGGLRIFKSYLK